MGAGPGPDRYHGVVLSWEYLVAPKFLLERDRTGGAPEEKLPASQAPFNEHLMSHRYLIHAPQMQAKCSGFQLHTSPDAHKTG